MSKISNYNVLYASVNETDIVTKKICEIESAVREFNEIYFSMNARLELILKHLARFDTTSTTLDY